jgi:hypothetical protein
MLVVIGWYAPTFDARIASVRIRCLQVIDALNKAGCPAERYSSDRDARYDAVVFAKAYDDHALALARSRRRRGGRVVFDLCDNHFFGCELTDALSARADRLRAMLEIADVTVVASSVLRRQVLEVLPGLDSRLALIPDALDRAVDRGHSESPTTMSSWLGLARVRWFLSRYPNHLHLLWFGSKGVDYTQSGLMELARVRDLLERGHRDHPLTLTIVSNSFSTYHRVCGGWRIPTRYVPWDLATFSRVAALHDAAIVPITHNPFTDAKTVNRPATALCAGIGVIADSIDSYEELRPFIYLDDWAGGIRAYATDRQRERERVVAAREFLERSYSSDRIAAEWIRVLSCLGGDTPEAVSAAGSLN